MKSQKRGFLFNSVPAPKIGYNKFDLSHENKLSAPMGKLIPILCMECLPGDIFDIRPAMLSRMQALISPMMQRVDASMLFFKEPYRHIWEGFEDFITGGTDGLQAPEAPYFTLEDLAMVGEEGTFANSVGSLFDYLGLPVAYDYGTNKVIIPDTSQMDYYRTIKLSALPLRAYAHIFNEYFRDQTLDDPIDFQTTSGHISQNELYALSKIQNRCWKKDYFTSALPTPQRGPDVKINLADKNIPVIPTSGVDGRPNYPTFQTFGPPSTYSSMNGYNTKDYSVLTVSNSGEQPLIKPWADSGLEISASEFSPVTIVALRTAFKLQQFLERNNVAGGRYIESVLAHFGVKSSDARLQRPEFLGGGSQPIVVSEVETNANGQGDYDNVVGDLAGKAKTFGQFGNIHTYCEEHSFIIGLLSYMPTASYSQGISRMWTRFDKYDYYWPEFQFVGEQAIKNKELFLEFTPPPKGSRMDDDFGYSPRYADYKYMPDRICGDMRTSLSFWHMSRLFDKLPSLNGNFVECKPTDRIFAVQDIASTQHMVADIFFDIKATRKMSKYSTPKMS